MTHSTFDNGTKWHGHPPFTCIGVHIMVIGLWIVVNVVYTVHSMVQISPNIWIPNLWVHRSYRSLDDIGHLKYLPYPHVCTIFACIKYLLFVQAQHIESSLGIVVIQILCILFWQSTTVIEIVCPI